MKITETTPKVERTFTLELNALELQSIVLAMGITCHADRQERADMKKLNILSSNEYHMLFKTLDEKLK